MEISKERKLELKRLVSILQSKSKDLKIDYKRIVIAVLFLFVATAVYIMYVVIGKPYLERLMPDMIYEVLIIVFALLYLLYDIFLLKTINDFKKKCIDGYKHFERLVNYVDWQAYRKKQLHNDSDQSVVEAINKFSSVANAPLSPCRSGINICMLSFYSCLFVQIVSFIIGVFFHNEAILSVTTELISNSIIQIGEGKFIVFLIMIMIALLILTIILCTLYTIFRKIKQSYLNRIDAYSYKFTCFCRFVSRFSCVINYNNLEVEYVPELKSLIERFKTLGDFCINNTFIISSLSFTSFMIEDISENINHLWYYLDDKIRYMGDGVEIDEEQAKDKREQILNELVNYTDKYAGDKVNWNLLRKVSGEFYINEWKPIDNLPCLYKISKREITKFLNFSILSVFIFVLVLCVAAFTIHGTFDIILYSILLFLLFASLIVRTVLVWKKMKGLYKQIS